MSFSSAYHLLRFPRLALLAAIAFCPLHYSGIALAAVSATGQFSPDNLASGLPVQVGLNGFGSLQIDDGIIFNSQSITLGA